MFDQQNGDRLHPRCGDHPCPHHLAVINFNASADGILPVGVSRHQTVCPASRPDRDTGIPVLHGCDHRAHESLSEMSGPVRGRPVSAPLQPSGDAGPGGQVESGNGSANVVDLSAAVLTPPEVALDANPQGLCEHRCFNDDRTNRPTIEPPFSRHLPLELHRACTSFPREHQLCLLTHLPSPPFKSAARREYVPDSRSVQPAAGLLELGRAFNIWTVRRVPPGISTC